LREPDVRPVPLRILLALGVGVFLAGFLLSEAIDPRWIGGRAAPAPTPTRVPVTLALRPLPTPRERRPATSPVALGPESSGDSESGAPHSSDSPDAGPILALVVETDGSGARFRATPGALGTVLAVLPEGTTVELSGQEAQVDGRLWLEVRDSDGQLGWVAAEFLADSERSR
jgi:SH3 domain-containing protein